jgi:hypothetical protein
MGIIASDERRQEAMPGRRRTDGPRASANSRVQAMFDALEETAEAVVAAAAKEEAKDAARAQQEAMEHAEAARSRPHHAVEARVDRLADVSETLMADADAIATQLRTLSLEIDELRRDLPAEVETDITPARHRRAGRFTLPADDVEIADEPDGPADGEEAAANGGLADRAWARLRELQAGAERIGEDEDDRPPRPRARGLSLRERFQIDDPTPRG